VRVICDNYATHKKRRVTARQARNPPLPLPLHADKRPVAQHGTLLPNPTEESLRRGGVPQRDELAKAIGEYIKAHNATPQAR
jgi:hypothetical protein